MRVYEHKRALARVTPPLRSLKKLLPNRRRPGEGIKGLTRKRRKGRELGHLVTPYGEVEVLEPVHLTQENLQFQRGKRSRGIIPACRQTVLNPFPFPFTEDSDEFTEAQPHSELSGFQNVGKYTARIPFSSPIIEED